jgi:dTDP-glucose pyrophosphorylase/CBS domain-containing protein
MYRLLARIKPTQNYYFYLLMKAANEQVGAMEDWKKILIGPETTILQAVHVLNEGNFLIALVVDAEGKLLGTVTDGDVRRGLLRNVKLLRPVTEIMGKSPVTAPLGAADALKLDLLRSYSVQHLPLLDEQGRVAGLFVGDGTLTITLPNTVVLMAGGMGTRLLPLTEKVPKPMLHVGERPILETIILQFIKHGFRRFYIAVNHLSEVIVNYFGDGSRWDVEIGYLRETTRLGTGGALSLLPTIPREPIFVMNGDLLTNANFRSLLAFHQEQSAVATMAVREYEYNIPYGVITSKDHQVIGMTEKPTYHYLVNAGIYCLEPQALTQIPKDTYFDITTLFERLMLANEKAVTYSLRDYWLDIGHRNDFERANQDYAEVFN